MTEPGGKPTVEERASWARLALEGVWMGDAFGGRFFQPPGSDRVEPPGSWGFSDDTVMARAIVWHLERFDGVFQDELAKQFADDYRADPYRGYGQSVRRVLEAIAEGESWRLASRFGFGGQGSLGNGAAMRVAPIGAYFADDLDRVIEHARASAEVTHAHPEGMAGAIATALAAAIALRSNQDTSLRSGLKMLEICHDRTPDGLVRDGLARAITLGLDVSANEAAGLLGNGQRITAPDTVPFALWCACRHIDNFQEALWTVVSVGGDNDTNGAIVGGIVVLASGLNAIPPTWLACRETMFA